MQNETSFGQSLVEQFNETMEIPGVSWIVYSALLVSLVLTAIYVVGLFRGMAMGGFADTPETDLDLLREIRNRDMIADEEFDKAKQLVRKNLDGGPNLSRDGAAVPESEFKPETENPGDSHYPDD